ncbi:hypothetical protein ACFVNQ_18395, partial [Bacillus subtilis]
IVPAAIDALRGKGIAALLGEIRPSTVELHAQSFYHLKHKLIKNFFMCFLPILLFTYNICLFLR